MFRRLLLALVLMPAIALAQDGNGYARRLEDKAQIAEREKVFSSEMHRLGFSGQIRSCHSMVQVAVGVRNGNISYGAICQVTVAGKTQQVMMCDDDMVGHFGLKAFTLVMTEEAVTDFVRRNCYGG